MVGIKHRKSQIDNTVKHHLVTEYQVVANVDNSSDAGNAIIKGKRVSKRCASILEMDKTENQISQSSSFLNFSLPEQE